MRRLLACLLLLLPALAPAEEMRLPPETMRLQAMSARFAPFEVRVDLSALPESERRALASLVKAARLTDALYMRQLWAGNGALLLKLQGDATPLGRARLLSGHGPLAPQDARLVELEVALPKRLRTRRKYQAVVRLAGARLHLTLHVTTAQATSSAPG